MTTNHRSKSLISKTAHRNWIFILLAGLLVLLLTSCNKKIVDEPVTLDLVLAKVNEERKTELEEPSKYLAEDYLSSNQVEFSFFEKGEVSTPGEVSYVSQEEISEDVDFLFRLMKYNYGCYTYFGGDEVFLKVKEEIIKEVKLREGMEPEELANLLLQKLSFLEDSHFSINHKHLKLDEKYYYTDNNQIEIRKDSIGFYTLMDNKRWYLDPEMDQDLQLTIADSGELVYGLYTLVNETESKALPDTLELSRGKKDREYQIGWSITDTKISDTDEDNQIYQFSENDRIPVVSLNTCVLNNETTDDLKKFVMDAEKLKDKKVAVLDLRDNHGGLCQIGDLWLYHLTGKIVLPKVDKITLQCDMSYYKSGIEPNTMTEDNFSTFKVDFINEYKNAMQDLFLEGIITGVNSDNKSIMKYRPSWLDRDNILFVLINKDTYSAAEYFLLQLSTISNVVFVGTNSNGCMTGDSLNGDYILPHSKVMIRYGNSLYLTDQIQNFDTRGFLPDICLEGKDPVASVLQCYQYYNQ
jgi:hypothetical protein